MIEGQKYKVRIKETATGVIRVRDMNHPWDEGTFFWWTDGNFGCDCNRELEFRRAAGESPALSSVKCGPHVEQLWPRFIVIDATLEDGTVIPIDGEEAEDILCSKP